MIMSEHNISFSWPFIKDMNFIFKLSLTINYLLQAIFKNNYLLQAMLINVMVDSAKRANTFLHIVKHNGHHRNIKLVLKEEVA